MSNENTKDLTDSEKLDLILTDMGNIKGRLAALEAFNDDRARDTRPLLAELHSYVAKMNQEMREGFLRLDRRFVTLAGDVVDLRNRQSDVESRVDEAGQRPS